MGFPLTLLLRGLILLRPPRSMGKGVEGIDVSWWKPSMGKGVEAIKGVGGSTRWTKVKAIDGERCGSNRRETRASRFDC